VRGSGRWALRPASECRLGPAGGDVSLLRRGGRLFSGAFLDGHGALANALTQVSEFGTPGCATTLDFDLFHARGMHGEDALDALTVADSAHGESGVQSAAAACDDHPVEELDTLFLAFLDFGVDAHGVTDREVDGVFAKEFRFNLVTNCLIHSTLSGWSEILGNG